MKFSCNIPIEAYEGSPDRLEKVEAIANKMMDLILENGLGYDEAQEVLGVTQSFMRQCKLTLS